MRVVNFERQKISQKTSKKVKKVCENLLTIKNVCDIITKLSAKRGSETVIEN